MITDGLQNSINVAEGVLEIVCLQDFPLLKCLSLKSLKHITTIIYKIFPKVNHVVFPMIPDWLQNFMSLSQVVP